MNPKPNHKFFQIPFLFLSAFILIGCGSSGSIEINDPWGRPATEGMNSAVYFQIDNQTSETDSLLEAHSDVADSVEVHMSVIGEGTEDGKGQEMGGDVMRMVQQEEVVVAANGQVSFEPGGLHVMLIGIRHEIEAGDSIELVLTFEKAGLISIDIPVEMR